MRKVNRKVNKQSRNYLKEVEHIVGTKMKYTKLGVTSDKFSIKFKVDDDVVSNYKLLVYLVLPSNEVITAVKQVTIRECQTPKVQIDWSKEQYSPGEAATLKISTHPNSLCSVTAVDKATRHLRKSKLSDFPSFLNLFSTEREPKVTSRITCVRHEKKNPLGKLVSTGMYLSLMFFLELNEFDTNLEITTTSPLELRRKRYVYQFAEDMDAFDILSVRYLMIFMANKITFLNFRITDWLQLQILKSLRNLAMMVSQINMIT